MPVQWAGVALLFLLPALTLAASVSYSSAFEAQSYTSNQANATIANATAYVNQINESGYLIFYPNLAGAYKDLALANQFLNRSPGVAVDYALKAQESARAQYWQISSYRQEALEAMIVITAITIASLYVFMKPVKGRKR